MARHSYSFEAFFAKEVLEYAYSLFPEGTDEAADLEEIGKALRRKAHSRRQASNACTASDLVQIPISRNKTVGEFRKIF